MAVGGKKARDADRDRAIDLVKAAWVEGQITEADRDLRVEKLLASTTVAQVHRLVTDLQSNRDRAPRQPPSTHQPVASVTDARRRNWPAAAAAAMAVVATLFVWSQLSASDDSTSSATPNPAPIFWSQDGVAALTDALIEQRGDSVVFSAAFHSDYVYVDVPVDSSTQRMHGYRWDGHELAEENASTADSPRFDLADVDPALPEQVLHRAEALVEDPTESRISVYVSENAEGPADLFHAYVVNEYGERANLAADRQGRVLSTSVTD